MIRALLVFAAMAAAAPAASAQHWRDGDIVSTSVEIADLDLSTRAGLRELDRRIDRAVSRICGSDRACRDDAWASSWNQANAAIDRDRLMRRLAAEREAELRACGWQGCYRQPQPAWAPAPPPPLYQPPIVTITVTYCPPPPPRPNGW